MYESRTPAPALNDSLSGFAKVARLAGEVSEWNMPDCRVDVKFKFT